MDRHQPLLGIFCGFQGEAFLEVLDGGHRLIAQEGPAVVLVHLPLGRAVGEEIHVALGLAGLLVHDAAKFQGLRVIGDRVTADPLDAAGTVAADAVQIQPVGDFLLIGPIVFVEQDADEPAFLPFFVHLTVSLCDQCQGFFEGLRILHVEKTPVPVDLHRVQVAVDKAGKHKMAFQVYHLGVFRAEFYDILVVSQVKDNAVLYGYGFHVGGRLIHRFDRSVVKDLVHCFCVSLGVYIIFFTIFPS